MNPIETIRQKYNEAQRKADEARAKKEAARQQDPEVQAEKLRGELEKAESDLRAERAAAIEAELADRSAANAADDALFAAALTLVQRAIERHDVERQRDSRRVQLAELRGERIPMHLGSSPQHAYAVGERLMGECRGQPAGNERDMVFALAQFFGAR